MKKLLLIPLSVLFVMKSVQAQNIVYNNRSLFNTACCTHNILNESFGSFASGQQVDSLFDGFITFENESPTTFSGGWQHHCASNEFYGNALIPEPRFQGNSLIMNFKTPVHGVGACVYDDHDGTPMVNVIKLSLITSKQDTLHVNETCDTYGEAGFLGGTSNDILLKPFGQLTTIMATWKSILW